MSSYQHMPTQVNLPSSTYLPVPIPKYPYIIAAGLRAGIGLVLFEVHFYFGFAGHRRQKNPRRSSH